MLTYVAYGNSVQGIRYNSLPRPTLVLTRNESKLSEGVEMNKDAETLKGLE